MNRKSIYLVIILLLVTSCIFEKRDSNIDILKAQSQKNEPAWLLNPEISKSFSAIGNAKRSEDCFNTQVNLAENDGRKKIIKQIDEKLSSILYDSISDIQFNDKDDSIPVLEVSLKEITNQFDLLTIKRNEVFLDHESNLYIHMSVNYEVVENYLKKKRNLFKKNIKNSAVSDYEKKQLEIIVETFYKKLCKL